MPRHPAVALALLMVVVALVGIDLVTPSAPTTARFVVAAEDAGAVAHGDRIARINPGSLPAREESALDKTVGYIDSGTTPSGALATKWGVPFKNWDRHLPGGVGRESPYLEYRVAPPPGTSGAGPLRVVNNPQTGHMYYTWTHYGDTGYPPFVQIR
jgi:guanyl-specific ribonuclease Sa